MRRRVTRAPVVLALASMLAALMMIVSPGTASAAESIPELQWPAIKSSRYVWKTTASPSGVTDACVDEYGDDYDNNLKTINNSGQLIRELNRNERIDDRPNCIQSPIVDKDGSLYGYPSGQNSSGSWGYGSNLLAYRGNTLKWKYPTNCSATPTIGADGNIYAISNTNGIRLIGLSPNIESGTVLPKKVLDVPYNTCHGQLIGLKDGIAILDGLHVTFYSYSGKSYGGPGNNIYIDRPEQINAVGRVFYQTFAGSGNTASVKVSAYDGFSRNAAWTVPETVFGSGIVQSSVSSIPNGGAVVLVRRTKSVGGVPTTDKVYALIKLNALGAKIWDKELPDQDASGNQFNSPRLVIDTNSKITIVRDGELKTNDPYNATMPMISIGVFDGNGNVVYDKIMRGNVDKLNGGVSGYRLGGQGTNGTTTGLNTLYILGECRGTCPSYLETKLYPIKIPGLGLDYPRGAVISRTPRPAAVYIAGGDSFSAGESVTPFDPATNLPGINTCHRSNYAYPRLIAGSSPKIPSLGSSGFRACSGAVSEQIWDVSQWNEGTQLDLWPDTTTKLVTLTVGGNDIGFGAFGSECFYATCEAGSSIYNTTLNKINNELPGKLEATYKKILWYAPNAKVYILGYPQVIGYKSPTDPSDIRCSYMQTGQTNWGDARAARAIVTQLNIKIRDVVIKVRTENSNNLRLIYVPLDAPGSPFNGHEICSTSTSWFQNVDQAVWNPAYVFHPNLDGQKEGYAQVAKVAINDG